MLSSNQKFQLLKLDEMMEKNSWNSGLSICNYSLLKAIKINKLHPNSLQRFKLKKPNNIVYQYSVNHQILYTDLVIYKTLSTLA